MIIGIQCKIGSIEEYKDTENFHILGLILGFLLDLHYSMSRIFPV